jgi:hypothetical protein
VFDYQKMNPNRPRYSTGNWYLQPPKNPIVTSTTMFRIPELYGGALVFADAILKFPAKTFPFLLRGAAIIPRKKEGAEGVA